MKKFKVQSKFNCSIIICLAVVLFFCSNSATFFADNVEIVAPAKSMITMEANTGTILYEFRKDERFAIASVTKIVTAIVAIENSVDVNESIVVSDNAVGVEGTSMYLKKEEVVTIKDLLFGLMLASGNDAAVALAEHFGGVDNFVQKMNDFVLNLGLSNTHFSNPHGLDGGEHYSSAYDLAIISNYAMNNELFRELSCAKYYNMDATNVNEARHIKNKNKLLFSMENCVGIKIGFTDEAGRCFVSAVADGDMMIVCVLLNCPPMYEEARRLSTLAINEWEIVEFVKPYSFVSTIDVVDGNKNQVGVATIKGYKATVLKSEKENYVLEYDLPNDVTAPININKPVGKVRVKNGEEIVFEENLYAIDESKNIKLKNLIENIITKW